MAKVYSKEELSNLKSTEKDGVINADKTFVSIGDSVYLLADLLTIKKEKVKKEKVLGLAKKDVKKKK